MPGVLRLVAWLVTIGAVACGGGTKAPPGAAGRAGSAGAAGASSGTGGADAGEGGDAGEAGGTEAGSGGGGRGGTDGGGIGGGGAGSAGKGGSAGTAGTTGNSCAGVTCSGHGTCSVITGRAECACDAGYATPSGTPTLCQDIDECASNHGGCDPRVSCTNTNGGRRCGDCPAGYGGSGDSGCLPKTCAGDLADCVCLRVAPDGDDASAIVSGGQTPFRSLQSAIDFADDHRNIAVNVCVTKAAACCRLGAPECQQPDTYSGPGGVPIVMRDGISVFGAFHSPECEAGGRALIVPAVEFGPEVQAPTTLDGFRLPAGGVVARGAREVTLSNLSIVNEGFAGTWCGIDASKDATLAVSNVSILSDGTEPGVPGELVGIRSLDSRLSVVGGHVTLYSGGGSAVGVWLDDSSGSTLDAVTVRLDTWGAEVETTLTGVRILGSEDEVVMSDSSVSLRASGGSGSVHHLGVDVGDAGAVALAGVTVSALDASGQAVGVRAVRSVIELDGAVRIQPDGTAGDAVELVDAAGSRVTATLEAQGRDDASGGFWGIHLSGDSSNVEIAGSTVSATAFLGRAGGIFLDGGDAVGFEIRDSTIAASGLNGEVTGIRLEDCGGAAPTILQNPSIVARARGGTDAIEAIRAAGDCHPRIEQNALIASIGDQGGGASHTGIHCAALSGVPSRCTIADNPDVRTESLLATPATAGDAIIRGTGIRCDGGSCASIVRNEVSGMVLGLGSCQRSCVVQSYGLHLEASSALVARNVLHAGCGGVARGLLGEQGANGRVENNFIYGRSADEECGTLPDGAMISSSIGVVAADLDVHSNVVVAGGSQYSYLGSCTSAAMSVGGGPVRNNLLSTGECDVRYVVMGGSGFAAFENNNLAPSASLTALFAPDLDLAAVNALPGSAANVSGCGLPPDSLCIDGGTPVGAPADDYYGNPRDEQPDIGPVEWIPPPP